MGSSKTKPPSKSKLRPIYDPVRAINETVGGANSWLKQSAAYITAIAGLVIAVEKLPKTLGLSVGECAAIAAAPILLVFWLQTFPAYLKFRRRRRLTEITGSGVPGYFRLAPRQDEESFQRADGAHQDVLAWLKKSSHSLLYLTGASGAGKSSLLSAWVIPHLEREGTNVLMLRGYQDPAASLAKGLRGLDREPEERHDRDEDICALLRAMQHRLGSKRLLVVFDQFEEFLILSRGPERDRFVQFLRAQAANSGQGAVILLVFRTDYDQFIGELDLPNPVIGDNLHKVPVFTEVSALRFLLGSGLTFDEDLQAKVLHEAAETEGTVGLIRPVTVNLCGLVLARFATGLPRQFRPGRIVRGFIREAIFQQDVGDASLVLLPKLISAHCTKVPRSIGELAAESGLPARQVRGAMFRLSDPDSAIVRPLDRTYDTWEISHDYLVPIIDSMMTQWRPPAWKTASQWIPWFALAVLLIFLFISPRLLPDPLTDLSARGWTIQPTTVPNTTSLRSYNLACFNCSTDDLYKSASDLRRIAVPISVELGNISSFDSGHFEGWARARNLKSLTLRGNSLHDISAVGEFPWLKRLSIYGGNHLSENQLRYLPPSLEQLNLGGIKISKPLAGVLPKRLWDLKLLATSNAAVRGLPPNIQTLDLTGSTITDAAIRLLPRGLASLSLNDTQIGDSGLAGLPRSLQELDLSDTHVTDAGIPLLPHHLTSLDLSYTGVTDAGVAELPKSIRQLSLDGTKVTSAERKKLSASIQIESFRPPPPMGLRSVVIQTP